MPRKRLWCNFFSNYTNHLSIGCHRVVRVNSSDCEDRVGGRLELRDCGATLRHLWPVSALSVSVSSSSSSWLSCNSPAPEIGIDCHHHFYDWRNHLCHQNSAECSNITSTSTGGESFTSAITTFTYRFVQFDNCLWLFGCNDWSLSMMMPDMRSFTFSCIKEWRESPVVKPYW